MAVVHILNKQSARDPLMMVLARRFELAAMEINILFKEVHIPTHLNVSCDALSGFQMERFRQAFLQADIAPWPLPKDILKITNKTYSNAFKHFNSFLGVNYGSTSANSIPVNVSCIMAFTTYMFSLAYAPSSIITYVSAISFVHKVGNWPDAVNNFVVQKMLIGIQKNLWYIGCP